MQSIAKILILTTLILLGACQPNTPSTSLNETLQTKPKHLVIIGIDALSPNGISHSNTPNLDKLSKMGAYTHTARAVLPTSSSPNWKSMVSSSSPSQHGVLSNQWERDDYILPPVVTGTEDIFPTIFGELRKQLPQAKIAAVYAWAGFGKLIERSALSYDKGAQSDQETATLAAKYLVNEKPSLLFVHLDWVDHVGHASGHKTEEYYQAVSQADQKIGMIIDAAEKADMLDQTVFIVTSDHGGIGYGHGGETLDEIHIPFYIAGKGIKKNHLIKQYVNTYDTGATAAHLLNIKQNPAWIGKIINSAFIGEKDPIQATGQSANLLTPPALLPAAHLYKPAGGLFIDKPAEMILTKNSDNNEIRYTLDGTAPTKASTLYTEALMLTNSATVKARSFNQQNQQSSIITGFYQTVSTASNNGIRYQYFEGDNWHFLPTFSKLEVIDSGTSYQFRINNIPQRSNSYAVRYTSWIQIIESGKHKFYTQSDDGSKLYIDGNSIVDNDGDHGTVERSGEVMLKAGYHQITVDYFNAGGGAWLEVLHKAPSGTKELIKPELLFLNKPVQSIEK